MFLTVYASLSVRVVMEYELNVIQILLFPRRGNVFEMLLKQDTNNRCMDVFVLILVCISLLKQTPI